MVMPVANHTSKAAGDSLPAIPFLDLKAQFEYLREPVLAAINRVLDSQHFIMGPEVAAFEKELAHYLGSKYAIGCASGSDAILLALMALGVGAGDEVVTTPFTFVATAGSIARLGAKPVFVDIDPVTYNIDPRKLEAAITARTKAIMPVHLFGLAADMDNVMEIASRRGVPVVEDAAQALGSRYQGKMIGTIGALGCFSFFPSKNLGAFGDGGIITTNDATLADRLKIMRLHGSREKYSYELLGMNSRLDAMQAAILRVKLPHLDCWAEGRRANAARYIDLLRAAGLEGKVTLPFTPAGYFHVFNQFVIRSGRRDGLRAALGKAGIPTEVYYPSPLHLQKAFAELGYTGGEMPQAEAACQQVVALPVYPELSEDQQRRIVGEIAAFYA